MQQREFLRKIDLGNPVLSLLSVKQHLWVGTSNGVKVIAQGKTDQFKLLATLSVQTRAIKDILMCVEEDDAEAEAEEQKKEKEKEKEGAGKGIAGGEVRIWTASDDNTICVWRVNNNTTRRRERKTGDLAELGTGEKEGRFDVTHLATLKGHG